jgi:hypothetical protein
MAKRLYIQLYNAKEGESITLPITPESIDLTIEQDIQTYNVLGFGEVPVRGNRQLQRINLSGMLPQQDTYLALLASLVRFLQYKPYSLQETNEMLEQWAEKGEDVRVIVSDGKLNKEFLIERKTSSVKEYTPDETYSYDLVEYRTPKPKTQILPNNLGQSKLVQLKERTINKYVPSQLTGQAGQTIYKLAKLTYGGRFKELMNRNGVTDANLDMAGKTIEMLPI